MTRILFLLFFLVVSPIAMVAAEQTVDFRRDVRPILSDKCFKCHGPDEGARKADLRLDVREDAEYVFSVESPDDSELLRRIASTDPDEQMPPPKSKLSLSRAEIDVLQRWVASGAAYEQHWSFLPPTKAPLPEVAASQWPRNEIDYFILGRLQPQGLSPNREADRELLVRRVTFDLTGLPPTVAEIDAFLADRSTEAYPRLVDRLLEREAFGERMAVDWLDVARYSDTYGYQVDRDRRVWPWRDWVVNAFNDNMPYDHFVTSQLAGDLLPKATDQQVLATTFNRLHPQKVEGGSVPEEFRVEYVADRTHTFATAFLGLTLECCRCHDHKYDPISQREYYQLFAFFNNIDEAGLYSYFTPAVPTPTLLLADDSAKAMIATLDATISDQVRALIAVAESRRDAFRSWQTQLATEASLEIPGQVAHLDFDEYEHARNQRVDGQIGQAVRLTGDDGIGLEVGNFSRNQPFTVALWLNVPDVKQRAVVFHRSRAWTDAGSRGYQLLIEDGRLSASLIHFWPGNAIRIKTVEAIPTGQWLHVAMSYDGSSRADGLRIYVDGKASPSEIVRDNLYKNITGGGGDNITIGERFRDRGLTDGMVDEFQVFERQLTPFEVASLHDVRYQMSSAPTDLLFPYYLSTVDPQYHEALAALQSARAKRNQLVDELEEIMVMGELAQRRPTFVLRRGAYDLPQEPVRPETPAALLPLPPGVPRDRLGLANWLFDPSHSLTSRVTVNRYWKMVFGSGLVRTPEDFGSQGAAPTHPRLLDWMARDFIDHGWDVKRLLRQIVSSSAYRQSSAVTAEAWKQDPDNRRIARGPRYRLPAEMVRDNALAASGLLVQKVGGPPVRPYDLAVSFKPVEPDKGPGVYRRSLYTFWKRTAPSPVMMTFDAAKRDVCTVKRERTASPLQAFVVLNDPQFMEAARSLAEQLLEEHGDNETALLVDAFRRLTGRQPTNGESVVLRELWEEQQQYFDEHGTQAKQVLDVGQSERDPALPPGRLAAATIVISTIFNSDQCMTKR